MNGQSHFFYKKYGSTIFNNLVAHQEIYGLKLANLLYNNEYSWAYLVKNGDWIKLKYSKYTIKSDSINRNDWGGEIYIMSARTNTRECFENSFYNFYFLTFTDISDFSCGYYDSNEGIYYLSVG